jgi:putative DNA primase/helicase
MFEFDKKRLSNGKELDDDEVSQLMAMNKLYTHVLFGSKNKIVCLKSSETYGQAHVFMAMVEFTHYTSDLPNIAGRNAGNAWTKWPGKNKKLDGVGFYPNENECPLGFFNTYIKPNVHAIEGDCSAYLEHLRDVICDQDLKAYEYLIQYFAHIVQKPQQKPNVAIVMKSVEGAGKGTMMKPLLQIFGAQGIHLNGDRHLTGQFNGVVANKLLIFADEVNLTSATTADKLKAFISESTVQMEKKGLEAIEIPNYARVIFASNRSHVIAAGTKERRYLVLEPSPIKAQDSQHFNALHQWIENGGASRLLRYLLDIDLETFNPFKAPSTTALIDQKLQSLSNAHQYIFEQLINHTGFATTARISATELLNEYQFWCDAKNISTKPAASRSQIGKLLTAIAGPSCGRSDRKEGKFYELPGIQIMREKFAELLNLEARDIFN